MRRVFCFFPYLSVMETQHLVSETTALLTSAWQELERLPYPPAALAASAT